MRILTCFLLLLLTVLPTAAQETGVVWNVPADFPTAASDLLEMRAVGIDKVRLGPVSDPSILRMADSLGLELFRDTGVWGLPAGALADSLDGIRSEIQRLAAANVPGWIGLGAWLDTSNPAVCALLSGLTGDIRRAGHRVYYITPLIVSDRCGSVADMVLIDALDDDRPERLLSAYRRAHPGVPVGLASAGTPVIPGSPAGHNVPGSVMYQARFMERLLTELDGEVVFVHRWRDRPSMDFWGRRYGLYDRTDNPRPALQVVRGLSLDLQEAFALPRADVPTPFPWLPIMGWGLLGFLGVLYAGSPRFRSMVPRYFMAHGFYRNAVREAREVLPLTSTALITVTGLSIGLVATVVLTGLHGSTAARYLYSLLPATWQPGVTAVLEAPLVLSVLLGCLALLSLSFWMGLWIAVAGKRSPLLASQALMLAVWPRWQVLPLLPLAMVLYGSPALLPKVAMGLALFLASLWASVRTSVDIAKVSRIRPGTAIVLCLLNPEFLLTVGLIVWMAAHAGETAMVLTLLGRDFGYG